MRGVEDAGFAQAVPKPRAAGHGGHNGEHHLAALAIRDAGVLFLAADVFAIGGVVH